jgi:hypothetical protein
MKLFRIALFCLCGVIVCIFIIGRFLCSSWHVERSIAIEAKPAAIYPWVAELERWPEWIPWDKQRDKNAEYSFVGHGVGATMSWRGKKLDAGTVTITELDPERGVDYELGFASMGDAGKGSILFASEGRATQVIWKSDGDVGWNPMSRLMMSLIESALGRDFEIGLKHLKQRVESKS